MLSTGIILSYFKGFLQLITSSFKKNVLPARMCSLHRYSKHEWNSICAICEKFMHPTMLKPLRLCSLCDGLGKHFYFLFNVRAAQIFAKNPGGNAFRTKFQGGTLFLGFNLFLLTSFLNIFLGGPMPYPPPPPPF
jgi:hypothetical protein